MGGRELPGEPHVRSFHKNLGHGFYGVTSLFPSNAKDEGRESSAMSSAVFQALAEYGAVGSGWEL